MGKVYTRVVIDVFCSLGLAKVYNPKMPITAVNLPYDRVLPFYEAIRAEVGGFSRTTAASFEPP